MNITRQKMTTWAKDDDDDDEEVVMVVVQCFEIDK